MNNPSNPNTNRPTINIEPVLGGVGAVALMLAGGGIGAAITHGLDGGGRAHNPAAVSHPFASSTEHAPITSDTKKVTLPSPSASSSASPEFQTPDVDPRVKAAAERLRTSAKGLAVDLVTQMGDPRIQMVQYYPGDIGNKPQQVDQLNGGNYSGPDYRASYDKDSGTITIEGLFTADLSHPAAEGNVDGVYITFDVSQTTAQKLQSKPNDISPANFLEALKAPGTALNSVERANTFTTLYVNDKDGVYVGGLDDSKDHYLDPANATAGMDNFVLGLTHVQSRMDAAFNGFPPQ